MIKIKSLKYSTSMKWNCAKNKICFFVLTLINTVLVRISKPRFVSAKMCGRWCKTQVLGAVRTKWVGRSCGQWRELCLHSHHKSKSRRWSNRAVTCKCTCDPPTHTLRAVTIADARKKPKSRANKRCTKNFEWKHRHSCIWIQMDHAILTTEQRPDDGFELLMRNEETILLPDQKLHFSCSSSFFLQKKFHKFCKKSLFAKSKFDEKSEVK